jgi:hypothetical protein
MATHITNADVAAYCRDQGWIIVGYDLALLATADDAVRVAVLCRDQRGHCLAVSAVVINDDPGIGIIDLHDASARFARLGTPPASAPGSPTDPITFTPRN